MAQFLIRADASIVMGTGHVMRCLTLANALASKGHNCHFICRDHVGHLGKAIKQSGFGLTLLSRGITEQHDTGELAHAAWLASSQEKDAKQVLGVLEQLPNSRVDCLVIDHYALDVIWESQFRSRVGKILVIDDLFDRSHECDILVNQNLGTTDDQYKALVPEKCLILAGIAYAMLRPEFALFRQRSVRNKTKVQPKQLLIAMGGVDPDNYTGRILEALKESPCIDCLEKIVVVLGETAPHIKSVEILAAMLPVEVEVEIAASNVAEIMSDADVAFGAAGSTSWERCCLGLPTLLFVIADNQIKLAELLEQHDAVVRVEMNSIVEQLNRLLIESTFYKTTSDAAALLCDGEGVGRVVSSLGLD